MKIPPIRPTFLLVLTAILIYGVAITVNMMCMAKGIYDWRAGQSFFNGIHSKPPFRSLAGRGYGHFIQFSRPRSARAFFRRS